MRTSGDLTRLRRRATVSAMAVVALVAVFQTGVIYQILGAQRDAAHIIDISGMQRMRSQLLGYYALSIESGKPEPAVNAKIEDTIAAMLATRAEILRERQYDTEPRDRNGRTALGRLLAGYIADLRVVERLPAPHSAFEAVRRDRPLVLAAYDRAVKQRVGIITAHNDRLVAALFLGLLLQIGSIVGVWLAIVEPSERRAKVLRADIRQARDEIESTFVENPDAIATYDRAGRMQRANAKMAELVGDTPEQLEGRAFSDIVSASDAETAQDAFECVLAGETVQRDIRLIARDGAPVDVAATLFPRLVDGATASVNVVAKDLRRLRAAEAINAEQTRRLSDLYDIASAIGTTTSEQLDAAIALLSMRLGYDYGAITEISADIDTVVSTYGDPPGLFVGMVQPLEMSLARLSVRATDAYEVRDFEATPYATPALRGRGWKSVAGMKIFTGGVLYGTVGFASRRTRDVDLSSGDIGFMRLACALLGTIIERGRQLRRLDSLAYSDSLTGLSNRGSFLTQLTALMQADASFALHYIDLDRFKKVNDVAGHAAGDAVLKAVAQRLRGCARADDVVARLGGDEFAIVQRGAADRDAAVILATRIIGTFEQPILIGDQAYDVGASVGIALYPANGRDAVSIVAAADSALYRAKRGGRGRFVHARVEQARASA